MTCVFGAPAERGSRRAGDGLQCWSDKVTIDGASVAQAQRAFVRFVADCASRWARTAVVVTRGKLSSFVGSRLCVKFSVDVCRRGSQSKVKTMMCRRGRARARNYFFGGRKPKILLWLALLLPAFVPSVLVLFAILPT